ncbi:unnamed protein product [Cylicocyclus nassatus]|uniref:Uncharacterized protein n=1 Tax=Cylicocyclus nassatus TaxID=53992 RepID=A0AA36M5N4_CYLNA|nr:unnamed protein product [Cylicocyclus nassatus]
MAMRIITMDLTVVVTHFFVRHWHRMASSSALTAEVITIFGLSNQIEALPQSLARIVIYQYDL